MKLFQEKGPNFKVRNQKKNFQSLIFDFENCIKHLTGREISLTVSLLSGYVLHKARTSNKNFGFAK